MTPACNVLLMLFVQYLVSGLLCNREGLEPSMSPLDCETWVFQFLIKFTNLLCHADTVTILPKTSAVSMNYMYMDIV